MKTRKELKEEYKNKKRKMGVFQIRNSRTNRILIDYSTDIDSKWNRHKSELKQGTHRNKELLKDWNKYGEVDFVCETLSMLDEIDEENLDYRKELRLLHELVLQELETKKLY